VFLEIRDLVLLYVVLSFKYFCEGVPYEPMSSVKLGVHN